MARDVFRTPQATVHETGFEIQEPSRRAEVTPRHILDATKATPVPRTSLAREFAALFLDSFKSPSFSAKVLALRVAMAPLGAECSPTICSRESWSLKVSAEPL